MARTVLLLVVIWLCGCDLPPHPDTGPKTDADTDTDTDSDTDTDTDTDSDSVFGNGIPEPLASGTSSIPRIAYTSSSSAEFEPPPSLSLIDSDSM